MTRRNRKKKEGGKVFVAYPENSRKVSLTAIKKKLRKGREKKTKVSQGGKEFSYMNPNILKTFV